MVLVKMILLFLVLISTSILGIIISKKYINRVNELKELKNAIQMIETKMKFTYEPIPNIFYDISKMLKTKVADLFKESSIKMKSISASNAWEETLRTSRNNLTIEDINILNNLSKLLGKTDLNGQISMLKLTSTFLDKQIQDAEIDKEKNVKLYKTLGITFGAGLVILLI